MLTFALAWGWHPAVSVLAAVALMGAAGHLFLALAMFAGVPVLAAIPLGAVAIAVMLVDKRAIWGAVQARTGLSLFPIGHRLGRARARPGAVRRARVPVDVAAPWT